MDKRIIWSPEAVEDVESIADFISRDSLTFASAVVEKVLFTSETLKNMSYVGRVVPEFNDEQIREKFVYSYRLIYQVKPQHILIVAVIHGKRLMEGLMDRI